MTEPIANDEPVVYSVKDFNERIHLAVKKWPIARVEGELVKFKTNYNGHAYPSLRDLNGAASLELVIFAGVLASAGEDFKDSDRVIVTGQMDFYQATGKMSLRVLSIKKVGLGDLLAQLEALRAKLRAEGVIDESKRKPLPFLPNRIGLITGQASDAEKDVRENVLQRWPDAKFEIEYVPVQGEASPAAVVSAIQKLDANPEVDVIVIARGGGAFLDLIGFSDERVLRAAAAADTPIVSAIGHEADRPLLDDVADLRASTPTDAAKRVVPDVADEIHKLDQLRQRLFMRVDNFVANQLAMVEQIRSRPILANPYTFIEVHEAEVERAVDQMRLRLDQLLSREAMQVGHLRQQVRSLSPQSTLDRGYSVVRDLDGHVISDAANVKKGQQLKVRLAKGELGAVAE